MDGLTYEALHGLAEHVVDYHGVIKLEPDTQAAWGAGPEYLVLGDKTNAFAKPCVMDVKIGTQTFEPDAPADKQARDLAKYPRQAEAQIIVQLALLAQQRLRGPILAWAAQGRRDLAQDAAILFECFAVPAGGRSGGRVQ